MSLQNTYNHLRNFDRSTLTPVQAARLSELAFIGARIADQRDEWELAEKFRDLYALNPTLAPDLVETGWKVDDQPHPVIHDSSISFTHLPADSML